MTAEESRDLDGRYLYGEHHPNHRHPQLSASTSSYSGRYVERPHLDTCRHHRQVTSNSRYIEAQMKNRMELMRLNERRQTLDRQQRSATTLIDRNKRKFAAQMANVTRTTSDLPGTVPPSGRRRQRAATAGVSGSRHRLHSYEQDESITRALAALQLYEMDVKRTRRRGFRPTSRPRSVGIDRMGIGIRSECLTASNTPYQRRRILPDRPTHQSTTHSNNTVTARACRSATGRPMVPGHDIHVRRLATYTSVSRTDSVPPDRAPEILPTSAAADVASAATDTQKSSETELSSEELDESTEDLGRKFASRWRMDLKREAPPAVYGHRPSLNIHAVMSQAERRRRLFALQTRQTAPLIRSSHIFKP